MLQNSFSLTTLHIEAQREHYLSKTIEDAVKEFLISFVNPNTRRTYTMAAKSLFEQQFLPKNTPLFVFSHCNLELILDTIRSNLKSNIKRDNDATEATREARCAFFISFTAFLQRRTQGVFKKVLPNKEGGAKTFAWKREHTCASYLNQDQIAIFFKALKKIGQREYLFAFLQFQG